MTPDEMQHLGPLLDLHPRAVEEVINSTNGDGVEAHRTKLERFPNCVLLYLYRSELGEDTALDLRGSPVIITSESVIAVEHAHPIEMSDLIARWEQNPELLDQGIPALLYALLDLVVDSYLDTVDALSDAVDDMEDVLFADQPFRDVDPREAQKRSFATRKALVRLRRAAQPMRELVSGLMRHEEGGRATVNAAMQPYYQDVYDHVLARQRHHRGPARSDHHHLRDPPRPQRPLAQHRHPAAGGMGRDHRGTHGGHRLLRAEHSLSGLRGPQWLLDQHRHLGRGFGPALRDVQASALALAG